MSNYPPHGAGPPLRGQPSSRGPSSGPASGAPARRGSRSHGAVIGLKIVAALTSLAILAGSGVAWTLYKGFVNDISSSAMAGPVDEDGKPVGDLDGKDQNILLVGDDSREGATAEELSELGTTENGTSDNTDTMMVLHVPADGRAASVMSFPRDSWVNIPGYGMGKMNSAFAYGKQDGDGSDGAGAALLGQVIYDLTGLKIDHFVKIGMLGFLRVANALGGVDVCLNEAQNLSTDSDADHPDGYTGIDLAKGWNYDVKGHQAIAFVRQRHGLPGGDIDRIARQQYFLSAAFRKVESQGTLLNPFKLQSLLHAVSSSLSVDDGLAGSGLLKLANQMTALTAGNLTFETVPNDGGSALSNGLSVIQIDMDALPAFVAAFVGTPTSYNTVSAAKPSDVSLDVINDTSGSGADEVAVAALNSLGFKASTKSSPDVSATTIIKYPNGMDAQAKAVVQYVPGATVSQTSAVTRVTLILGNDGLTVADPAASGGSSGSGGGGDTSAAAPAAPASSPSDAAVRHADTADCVN